MATVPVRTIRVVSGFVTIPVSCSRAANAACEGAVSLRARIRGRLLRLGGGEFFVEPGRRDPVQIALTRRARALMKSRRRLRAFVLLVARDADGPTTRTTKNVTLVRGRRR